VCNGVYMFALVAYSTSSSCDRRLSAARLGSWVACNTVPLPCAVTAGDLTVQ
jgi:hypothetical protein